MMPTRPSLPSIVTLFVLLGAACSQSSSASRPTESSQRDAGVAPAGDADGATIAGLSLMRRLPGLWSGPATMTRLGDFPLLNMDFQPATPRQLFGRVDLDADNALRFAFFVGAFGGKDVLTFRNGGLFEGRARDSWTVLVESDDAAGRYRFCAADRGCEYIDATFTFPTSDELVLDVLVQGKPHEHWTPRRTESGTAPEPFPADVTSQGSGDEPFPEMPKLSATVSFGKVLPADADVWLLLSRRPCTAGDCLSRSFTRAVKAGSSSTTLLVDQVHGGAYRATAILDPDRNLRSTYAPSSGDGVSTPNQSITIAAQGTTDATLPIVVSIP